MMKLISLDFWLVKTFKMTPKQLIVIFFFYNVRAAGLFPLVRNIYMTHTHLCIHVIIQRSTVHSTLRMTGWSSTHPLSDPYSCFLLVFRDLRDFGWRNRGGATSAVRFLPSLNHLIFLWDRHRSQILSGSAPPRRTPQHTPARCQSHLSEARAPTAWRAPLTLLKPSAKHGSRPCTAGWRRCHHQDFPVLGRRRGGKRLDQSVGSFQHTGWRYLTEFLCRMRSKLKRKRRCRGAAKKMEEEEQMEEQGEDCRVVPCVSKCSLLGKNWLGVFFLHSHQHRDFFPLCVVADFY